MVFLSVTRRVIRRPGDQDFTLADLPCVAALASSLRALPSVRCSADLPLAGSASFVAPAVAGTSAGASTARAAQKAGTPAAPAAPVRRPNAVLARRALPWVALLPCSKALHRPA